MSHWYRNGSARHPFAWGSASQPAARWHGEGEGPACYLADTPDGAWAEFVRHLEITDPEDLLGIERRIWAVEVDDELVSSAHVVDLPDAVLRGGLTSYRACQEEAARARAAGSTSLIAPSAALLRDSAGGQAAVGLSEAAPRDGRVLVLFGVPADLRVWAAVDVGRPTERVLERTAPLV